MSETTPPYQATADQPEKPEKRVVPIPAVNSRGIVITDFFELKRMCEYVLDSGITPKGIDTLPKLIIVAQTGLELGLPFMAALSGIGVINNRPCVYGDNLPALAMRDGLMEEFDEWFELSGTRLRQRPSQVSDGLVAVCEVKRRGRQPYRQSFSWVEAKAAELDKKAGPWTLYPARQMQMRARAWAIRDQFPDVLRGISVYEEAQDIEPRQAVGREVDPTPEQQAARIESEIIPPTKPRRGRPRKEEPAQLAEPAPEWSKISPESRAKIEAAVEEQRNPGAARARENAPEPDGTDAIPKFEPPPAAEPATFKLDPTPPPPERAKSPSEADGFSML